MKIEITDKKSALEYISHVLNEWVAFCNHHPTIAKALEVLLETNKDSTERNEK